ncbi:hypothetical protein LJR296_007661 [Cupriavidus necator]|uniref:hypothetical protein n=1 Tax=Cupriavidus necator TaxID=106590 RepID=UPI003ECE97E2
MNARTICGLAIALTSVAPMTTSAAEPEPKILYTHKPVPGKTPQAVASALINMDEIFDRPDDNCEQRLGNITVEGIRFSQSGATLESFRFTDKKGNQWSVPTNIGKLPGAGTRRRE